MSLSKDGSIVSLWSLLSRRQLSSVAFLVSLAQHVILTLWSCQSLTPIHLASFAATLTICSYSICTVNSFFWLQSSRRPVFAMNKYKYAPNDNAGICNDDFYEVIEEFLREQNVNSFSLFEYTQQKSPSLLLKLFAKVFNKAGFTFPVESNFDAFVGKLNAFIDCLNAPMAKFNRSIFNLSNNVNKPCLRALAWLIQNRFEPILSAGKTSLRQREKEEAPIDDLDFGKIGDYLNVHLSKEITTQGGFEFAHLDKRIQERRKVLERIKEEDAHKLNEAYRTKNALKVRLSNIQILFVQSLQLIIGL